MQIDLTIQKLVANNEIDKALSILIKILSEIPDDSSVKADSKEQLKPLIVLAGRNNNLKDKLRKGIISSENAGIEKAAIANSILEMMDILSDSNPELHNYLANLNSNELLNSLHENNHESTSLRTSHSMVYISIALIIIAGIVAFMYFNNKPAEALNTDGLKFNSDTLISKELPEKEELKVNHDTSKVQQNDQALRQKLTVKERVSPDLKTSDIKISRQDLKMKFEPKSEYVTVLLIVNADFSDATIKVDQLNAEIVSDNPNVKKIRVEKNKNHTFELINPERTIKKTIYITENDQKIICN